MKKEAKIYNGEKTVSSISGWENKTAICERMILKHFLTPYTKVNLKCITDLNVRPETTTILEENIGGTLFDISLINAFLDLSPQARETKAKINKWTTSN